MGFVSDIIKQGYGGYAGWNDAAAQQDFNATGGAGKRTGGGSSGSNGGSASNPVDELIKRATEAYQKQIDEYTQKSKEFDQKNPWVFDDVLSAKRKEVSDRLDPFYNQTLEDYLRGVNVRRTRSIEDQQKMLTTLNADVSSYTGKSKQLLDDAIQKSGEGFADAGTFFSGQRLRDEGKLKVTNQQGLNDTLTAADRQRDSINTTAARNEQDLSLEEMLKRRDLNTDKFTNVESGALSETNLAQATRELQRNQFIGGPYASNSLSTLPSTFSGLL